MILEIETISVEDTLEIDVVNDMKDYMGKIGQILDSENILTNDEAIEKIEEYEYVIKIVEECFVD